MGQNLPDFDELTALYRRAPQEFEALRRQVLREAVERAPAVHRPALDDLLDRIEAARETAASPMDAVLVASRMMRESAERLLDAWEDAQEEIAGLQTAVLIEKVAHNAALTGGRRPS